MFSPTTAFTDTEPLSAIVRNPLIVTPETSVIEAIAHMSDLQAASTPSIESAPLIEHHQETRSSCVLVMSGEQLQGIITERDIVRLCSQHQSFEALKVQEIMAHPVITLQESALTDPWVGIDLLHQHQIRHLPILDEHNHLVGLVTHETLGCMAQREAHAHALEQQVEERTRSLQAKVEQAQLVAAIATQIRSSLSLQTILDTTVEQIRQVLSCDRVNIWHLKTDGSTVAVAESTDSSRSLLGECLGDECFQRDQAEAYRQGKIRVVKDVDTIEISDCHRDFLKRIQTRSKILVPLLCGDELWGLLNACEADKARNWQPEEVELMQALAVQLAIALQQATTHEQLQAELKTRQQTEARLRESEQRYASLVAASPVGILHADLKGICIYANEHYCEILGIDSADIIGHPWFRGHEPDVQALIIQQYERSLKNDCPLLVEYPARHSDGSEVWVYGQVVKEYDAEGQLIGYVGTITDISDRKQAESLLEEQFQILERIAKAEPLQDIFQALLHAMEAYLSETVCTIMLCQDGQLCHACAPSLPQTYIDTMETSNFPIAEGVGTCGTAAYRGEMVIAAEIATDPLWQDYKQLAFAHGLRASWSIPVFDQAQDQSQTVLAVFGIYYREARAPQPHEIEFVKRLANLAGIAIERSQASQALEQLNQELENRVRARTAELEASKRRYASLATAAPVAILRFDTPLHCVYVNERWCEMTGRSAESAMGYGWLEAVHPDDRVLSIEQWTQDDGHPGSETQMIHSTEARHVHPDGTITWCHVNIAKELDDDGNVAGYVGTLTDITACKVAELALQESQTQLRRLTDSIPGMVFRYILHPDGSNKFTYVSSYIRELYEMTPEEVLGQERSPWDIVHPDDIDYLASKIQRSAQTLEPIVVEHRFILSEGRLRWGQNIGQPKRQENGDVVWYGVSFDITDRKQVEEQLQRLSERLELAISSAQLGIWEWDHQENYLTWDDRILEIYGVPSEAFGGTYEDWINSVHPEDLEQALAQIPDSTNSSAKRYTQEFRIIRPDGSIRYILATASIQRNAQGQAIRSVGINLDITERKTAELALEREVLRRSAIFEASPDGIHILDRTGNLLEANTGFAKMLGCSLEEVSLMHVADWEAQWSRAEIKEILDNYPSGQHATFETLHRRKDGSIFPVEISQCAMEWNGEFAMVCISRDISERKQAEVQLQHTNQELARATRLKDEFLANISHELRTPLNSVIGFSQLMQRDSSLSKKNKETLDTINRSGEHLLSLINDILEMSKIEAGQATLNLETVELPQLLDELRDMMRIKAEAKNLHFDFSYSSKIPRYIEADEVKLRQILLNLLSNALKFTEQGQVSFYVKLIQTQSSDSEEKVNLKFSVTDTGPGISVENQKIIFQPFVQVSSGKHSHQGSGLGLPISQNFAKMMGGNIYIDSIEGQGSTFYCEICVHQLSSGKTIKTASYKRYDSIQGIKDLQASYRLLVVDDNLDNSRLLSQMLSIHGFEVETASNGLEAIEWNQNWQPHLIWMDIRMPMMDGLEATHQIRQSDHQPKIIAITANAFAEERETALKGGCDDFISKPFSVNQVFERLERWLGLEFIFEQEEEESPDDHLTCSPQKKSNKEILQEGFRAIPLSQQSALKQAIAALNHEAITSLLSEFPEEQRAMVDIISALQKDYRYDILVDILNIIDQDKEDS